MGLAEIRRVLGFLPGGEDSGFRFWAEFRLGLEAKGMLRVLATLVKNIRTAVVASSPSSENTSSAASLRWRSIRIWSLNVESEITLNYFESIQL